MSPEKKYMDKLFKEYMLPDRFPLIAVSTFLSGYFFGEDGLAAFSFMLPIYFLFIVAGFGINFGAFSLAVEAVSKSQSEVAQKYSTAALKLSIAVGLILAVVVNVFFWLLVEFEHVPPNLYPLVESYGRTLAICGFFLVISVYLLQFLKLIGLQSRLRKIYKVMLILNAAIIFLCVKVLDMGMEAIAVGMITAAIFCLLSEGRQLHMRLGKNLFAPVKFSEIPIGRILRAGSAVTLSKIFSLSQIVLYNFYTLHAFGLKGVAVFASLQIAIRICRTASGMTLQGITPILTIELGDKNLPAMKLLLKTALRRGLIFAILPMIILLVGASYFTESLETVEALRIYSLSLIPAAINAIMLTALLAVGHVMFSNLLAFLRSFALLIIFLAGAYTWQADLVWWSFLFAELVTLAVLIIGVKILQRKGTLLPKMPPSNFFVINRQLNLEEQLPKGLQENVAKILSEWVALNQKFNDRKKDNFTAVQIRTDDEKILLTLRSNGKLFDYRKYFSENPREDLLRLVDAWKFKFVLGLNNFYAQVR
ncbi:MAG: hypothetical protein IKD73_01050 [Selenomonadaceae bacterium]|nr:hypothetical protein [Selenomonadaceae bacterium]